MKIKKRSNHGPQFSISASNDEKMPGILPCQYRETIPESGALRHTLTLFLYPASVFNIWSRVENICLTLHDKLNLRQNPRIFLPA